MTRTITGTNSTTSTFPLNPEMMDMVEILHWYKQGQVTFEQLDHWAASRLQDCMDRMAVMDLISSMDTGDDALAETEVRELILNSPAVTRLTQRRA